MAQINDFLSLIDFEAMRGYCMANGKSVRYAKGDRFVEEGQIGRYVGFVTSGYFKLLLSAKLFLSDLKIRADTYCRSQP